MRTSCSLANYAGVSVPVSVMTAMRCSFNVAPPKAREVYGTIIVSTLAKMNLECQTR